MGGISGNYAAGLDAFAKKVNCLRFVGAQAMAQVVYNAAKQNAPVSEGPHVFYGTHASYHFKAGTLRDSIYQVMSQDNSVNGRAEYHVAWNHKKCPYGFMVEFGTSRSAAHPFLHPAYEQNKAQLFPAALAAMQAKFAGRA